MQTAQERGEPRKLGPRRSVHSFLPGWIRPLTIAIGRVFRDWQYRAMNAVTRVYPAPLFVLGNQKSGTSAIAGLLARATGRPATLDLAHEVWQPTYYRIPSGEQPFESFLRWNRWGFSREIIKEPNLTLFHPELKQHFPEATYLFVVRDPRDNIRSLLDRMQLRGDLAELPPNAADWPHNPISSPGWTWVFDMQWRGIPVCHYIELQARRWQICADVYLENADDMVLCRYEEFRADKTGTITRLAEQLGYPVVNDIGDRLDYQFQPPGDPTQRWDDFFGAENRARIEAICRPGMEALGYPLGAVGESD